MPPKAARGAGRGKASARGRGGGGRGRGASSANVLVQEVNERTDSQSIIVDFDMPDADNTTPIHQQDQDDPNYSPATQPTETPAPTPVRVPAVTSNANGTAVSGSGRGGTPAPKPSKFKPRIVRAGAREREEREARERERENARLGALAATAARESRVWGNRGRGGRGRGDAMGRGRGVNSRSTASGPFAAAPPGREKRGGFFTGDRSGVKRDPGAGFSGGSKGGASVSHIKAEDGTFAGRGIEGSHDPVAGRYIPEPQYPDEDDDAPRVDIEHINLASDDDDVVITGFGRSNKGKVGITNNLKPIRLDRKEHKERVTIVNTESKVKPTPEDGEDITMVDEGRPSKAAPHQREWKGTYDNEVQIKTEPGTVPEISYSQAPTPSSPPPAEFKIPAEVGADDEAKLDTEGNVGSPESLLLRTQRSAMLRHPSKKKPKMPVMQTEEDRAEWERHLEDMDVLRTELVGLATHQRPQNKGKDVEGDVDMEAHEHLTDKEDGRIYLFQFPPVLPKLFDEKTGSNPNLKDEDVEIMELHDLTQDPKVEIKTEEKVVEIKQEEVDADEELRRKEREALVAEGGFMGRLVVRESGQVELVWGGTDMKVGRGVETSFFSTGAVVDSMDQWTKDDRGRDVQVMQGSRGVGHAMGEIMGKFVVTPNWTNAH